MASTYLSRTTVTPTNATKFTFSAWCKIANVSGRKCILGYNGGNHWYVIQFDNSADNCRFEWVEYNSGGTKVVEKYTSASLRDVNGYYHIVCKYNSTLSTVADRTKLYINGELADLATNNNPSHMLEAPSALGGHTQLFGAYETSSNNFDGIISHAHYCDGYAYDASAFGSTDATTGEWKINTSPSVTYGNNGFFILEDGNSVTDQSGNSNNFTVGGGTLTKTEDNPSNVFATLNPLVNNAGEMMLLTNGNTSCQSNAAQGNSWKLAVSTLGMTSGKYYCEIKFDNVHNCYNNGVMGSNILTANTSNPMNQTGYTGFYNIDGGEIRKDNVVTTQDYGTYATNDIMGVACDMDNYTITFYKNGSAFVSNVALSTTGRDAVFPCSVFYNTNNTGIPQASYNFGNGYFGTTAVSSAGTNASGNGIFEYDVPTGYTALSTKGLNL